jgi:hypothetical protein
MESREGSPSGKQWNSLAGISKVDTCTTFYIITPLEKCSIKETGSVSSGFPYLPKLIEVFCQLLYSSQARRLQVGIREFRKIIA